MGIAIGPELYRHKKTGGVYEVICNATIERTLELAVVYRNTKTGERWVRPAAEFNDGRFERVAPNAEVTGGPLAARPVDCRVRGEKSALAVRQEKGQK